MTTSLNNINEKKFILNILKLDMQACAIALRLYEKTKDKVFHDHAKKLMYQINKAKRDLKQYD